VRFLSLILPGISQKWRKSVVFSGDQWVSTILVSNPETGKSYLWEIVLERSSFSASKQIKSTLTLQR
jgi:hypothetical protein